MAKKVNKDCTHSRSAKKRKTHFKKSLKPLLRVLYNKYIITCNTAKDNSRVDQTQKLNSYITKQPFKLIN